MEAIAIPSTMVKYIGIPTRNTISEKVNSIAIILGSSKTSRAGIWW